MGILQEFKEFAMKGNVIDLAVGVIIGGAFGKIVTSLVNEVIMPMVGNMLGGINFQEMYFNLGVGTYATLADAVKAGAPVVKYGVFLSTVVDFVIIAFVIFMAIKAMNKLKRSEEAAAPAPAPAPEELLVLKEIRDSLKKA